MSGTRQNLYDSGAYQDDLRVHGDNGLRLALGRAGHRRPPTGSFRMLAPPDATIGATFNTIAVLNTNTFAFPLTVNTPQAEQFILTQVFDPTLNANNPTEFLCYRFMLNNDIVGDWLQPIAARMFNVHTNAAAQTVVDGNYNPPGMLMHTLSFDQVQFALIAACPVSSLQVNGMYATGSARFGAVTSQSNV